MFLSAAILLSFFLMANLHAEEGPLLGSWSFEVAQAPWEYSKGKVIFETGEENLITAKVLFDSGRQLSVREVLYEDGEVRFQTMVDGYRVNSVFILEDDSLTGHVETVEGNMDFKASREKEETAETDE